MRREVGAAGRSAPLIRECLLARLAGPLPGASAHRSVWPERLGRRVTLHDAAGYADASVLIALHHTANGIRFPLIKRPEAMRKHPGQVALPGGRCEAGESGVDCALREAREEIGLEPGLVEILGQLTPVPVGDSRFLITPVVAWVASTPTWSARAGEVETIFEADPDLLAREGPRLSIRRNRGGVTLEVPAYAVNHTEPGETPVTRQFEVWGATALMLAEFLAVWRDCRGSSL